MTIGQAPIKLKVQLNNGEWFEGTYREWSDITGHNVPAIQKRNSVRRAQIKAGVKPHTLRQVVGLDELNSKKPHKPKPDNTAMRNEMFKWFARRKLA